MECRFLLRRTHGLLLISPARLLPQRSLDLRNHLSAFQSVTTRAEADFDKRQGTL
jgi:hypothetical protein